MQVTGWAQSNPSLIFERRRLRNPNRAPYAFRDGAIAAVHAMSAHTQPARGLVDRSGEQRLSATYSGGQVPTPYSYEARFP